MRQLLAVALLATTVGAADAAPLAPAAMHPVLAQTSAVETVACVRGGWRGVGVYPGCRYYRPRPYYYARPVVVAPPVVVAGPAVAPAPRRCWIAGAWRPC